MKLKYKTRKTISQILSVVLVCALGLGAIFGVSALSKKLREDTKTIHPTFEVGGINAEGKGDKDMNSSIYTKEGFECKGLEIKLDFDANIKYSVYYYDEYDNYISNTVEYTESRKLSVPYAASNARVVVTPIWNSDIKNEDRVCHWYDVTKYASQLDIIVAKDQSSSVNGLQIFDTDNVNLYSSDMTTYAPSVAPFMFINNENIVGRKIVKIGVPVHHVFDCTVDNNFTVYVVKDDAKGTIVRAVDLTIPANTYSSESVLDWYYFHTNIDLDEDETLAFFAPDDTVIPLYSMAYMSEFGSFYTKVGTTDRVEATSGSLIIDLYVAED